MQGLTLPAKKRSMEIQSKMIELAITYRYEASTACFSLTEFSGVNMKEKR